MSRYTAEHTPLFANVIPNDVGDTMHLVYCRVIFSETKLMRWHCFSAMMGLRHLCISFSNSFDMIGSNEIGRYDSTSLRFLPGFGIMITSAASHASGI
jgi:hypothetical protein